MMIGHFKHNGVNDKSLLKYLDAITYNYFLYIYMVAFVSVFCLLRCNEPHDL